MTRIITTRGYAFKRYASGRYIIRNLATGRWTKLAGAHAFLLDLALIGCTLAAIDGVLVRFEVLS